MPYFDSFSLKEWFLEERRALPWRENPSPYRVWVSEIMLQQTQAAVVIPYFERWMRSFPTIEALAQAPLEEVIKLWEGLGYYARARYLHGAAKELLQKHAGVLPSTKEGLQQIKGIGLYTVGAILSFAFHKKAAAVDGNVLRVLSRYFAIEEEIEKAKKRIEALTEEILPEEEPWVVMEALIELGARVCRKIPLCNECPLKRSCVGYSQKIAHLLPNKRARPKTTLLKRAVLLILHGDEILIGRVEGKKVMAGLYEFPYKEFAQGEPLASAEEMVSKEFKISAQFIRDLKEEKHSFTRYQATLYPSLWKAHERIRLEGYEWVSLDALASLPFSSGHLRIMREFLK
ncbi:MAG: A/G-specific adenine glycosylase [Chlamydiales bacterium]|nr:A/G-specific adenine glycosylase [Chlamydiales bacterium]